MKTSTAGPARSTRTIARTMTAAGVISLTFLAVACDEDEKSAMSKDEWCASVKSIDEQFTAVDNSDDPFEDKQDAYNDIKADLEELADSIDTVDEEQRDAVQADLEWAIKLSEVVLDADDEASLEEAFFAEDGLFAEQEQLDPAGAQWILDNCDVDINGEE